MGGVKTGKHNIQMREQKKNEGGEKKKKLSSTESLVLNKSTPT